MQRSLLGVVIVIEAMLLAVRPPLIDSWKPAPPDVLPPIAMAVTPDVLSSAT